MEPNIIRPQNASQQNFTPYNYQVPQHQGYPQPQSDYDPHHQHSIVVPMQATNADINAQERVSVPTQESNPEQQAGIKQSAQDPKESLDKELMKGLQGDIRGAAEGVKAATEQESCSIVTVRMRVVISVKISHSELTIKSL